ncbi:hypothetical protein B0H11DRAFT_1036786 [Mycena galericulata]|nr:hypothetical protein B0H11DRAFT_671610 [Mycena galericulata]KAJ7510996.1 hypothetical protein B0H11DRAFT_1036786 [Mycena galericulata]
MSESIQGVCICMDPGTYRCSKSKTVSYCSRSCQILHWRTHKHECRKPGVPQRQAMLRVGSTEQLEQLLGIGKQNTQLDKSLAIMCLMFLPNLILALEYKC